MDIAGVYTGSLSRRTGSGRLPLPVSTVERSGPSPKESDTTEGRKQRSFPVIVLERWGRVFLCLNFAWSQRESSFSLRLRGEVLIPKPRILPSQVKNTSRIKVVLYPQVYGRRRFVQDNYSPGLTHPTPHEISWPPEFDFSLTMDVGRTGVVDSEWGSSELEVEKNRKIKSIGTGWVKKFGTRTQVLGGSKMEWKSKS